MGPLVVRLLFIAILVSNGIDDPIAAQCRPVGEPDTRLEDGNSYIVHFRRPPNEDGGQEITEDSVPIIEVGSGSSVVPIGSTSTAFRGTVYSANSGMPNEIHFLLSALQP